MKGAGQEEREEERQRCWSRGSKEEIMVKQARGWLEKTGSFFQ